jgi:hypothetical protein
MVKFIALLSLFAVPFLGQIRCEGAERRVDARVVDDVTGQPLAARVAITNAAGKFVEIQGKHSHVDYLGKRWCYVDGRFSVDLEDAQTRIEIRRGFETLPFEGPIGKANSDSSNSKSTEVFRLHRWIDMRTNGWFNGDIHAHLPSPEETRLQMEAEDLNAQTLLYLSDSEPSVPVNKSFTGRLDAHSTIGREIYVAQELQDFQMGHLTLLGITNLVNGYPQAGGGMEFWTNRPHWDMIRALRGAKAQNAIVFWSHIDSLPGAQLPIGLALGMVDGVELITWIDPTQLPNHWDPWLNSGFSQAEFPVMRSLDLYYTFLNAGFRVPIAAGTDKFYEEIPLGCNRVYVKDATNYASWLAGVKAGRAFVCNGPMLDFEVDGLQPGGTAQFQEAKTVRARVTARSILPFNTLDIVINGQPVAHKSIAFLEPINGLYTMEIETNVVLTNSVWLAARVVDNPDLRNPILPRNTSVFAHTAPVYFLRDGLKVREQASIDYLKKYVEGVLHWLSTRPPFYNEEDRQRAQKTAEEALAFFKRL